MAAPQLKTYFKKFKSDHLGQIQLTGIVNIRNFDTVNLEVTNWPDPIPNLTVAVHMGKISGATLAQEIDHFSLGGPVLIHTYSVAGPTLPSGFRERLPRLTSRSRPGCSPLGSGREVTCLAAPREAEPKKRYVSSGSPPTNTSLGEAFRDELARRANGS